MVHVGVLALRYCGGVAGDAAGQDCALVHLVTSATNVAASCTWEPDLVVGL
jgi:hypothetical protein